MEINPLFLILGGLFAMFFGYFFGLFEGRGQGYKKRKAEQAEQEKQDLLNRAAQPASEPEPPVIQLPPLAADDPGLLRVKEQAGSLQLELDGMQISAESFSPLQRKRLIEVITRLRPWIEGRPAAAPAPAQPASPAPSAPPPPPAPSPAPSAPPPSSALAPVSPPPPSAPGPTVGSDEPVPGRSMVSQIDEILQRNIAGTPLATRGIRLMDAPGGGVAVFIGMQRYSSIGDVTDPEILAALRLAVATWEKTYTPGK